MVVPRVLHFSAFIVQKSQETEVGPGCKQNLKREKSLSGQDVIFVGDGGTGSGQGYSVCLVHVHPPIGMPSPQISTNSC